MSHASFQKVRKNGETIFEHSIQKCRNCRLSLNAKSINTGRLKALNLEDQVEVVLSVSH